MLSVTCNNASNNNTMVDELGALIDNFSGGASQTCCFAHIINLITKMIIQQFDVPKTKEGENVNVAMAELLVLSSDMDVEDLLTQASHSQSDGDSDEDNEDGWVDEKGKLLTSDLKELEEDIQPI
jgi:hypothetical protein